MQMKYYVLHGQTLFNAIIANVIAGFSLSYGLSFKYLPIISANCPIWASTGEQ